MNDTELVVLALTAEGLATPPLIREAVAARALHLWGLVGRGAVDYAVERLVAQGLLRAQADPADAAGPRLALTRGGREVLTTALYERLAQAHLAHNAFELALVLNTALRPAQVVQALERHMAALVQRTLWAQAQLAEDAATPPGTPQHALAARALALAEAERAWLAPLIDTWRAHAAARRIPLRARPAPPAQPTRPTMKRLGRFKRPNLSEG